MSESLSNPAWFSLITTHVALGEGSGRARRYVPDVAAFAAVDRYDDDGWSALAELQGPGASMIVLGPVGLEAPAGWERLGGGLSHQMVLGSLAPAPAAMPAIRPLASDDVPQMLELVEVAQPGPFRKRTIELGRFVGVFSPNGTLLAMAGERMHPPGFTEVSGVCTHPDARGQGLAHALSHHVATGIMERGETPILHVASSNVGAQRVYERLGFRLHQHLDFLALRTPT